MSIKPLLILACTVLMLPTSVCATDREKISKVKSGEIKEARAEWWGFDADDSTNYLQTAIDSGVPKLIIGKMKSPWLVRPIRLQSNQEIILEKGVVVQALPGAYKDIHDCLLYAYNKKNIILRGPGTLLMNKKEYQNNKLYKHSEWRHAISLRSCENIKIIALNIKSSGGDGIYIGRSKERGMKSYCKGITIKDCVIDDNHRQAISVISAEDLLISNCKLDNTEGTAPMAGIDFEPNHPVERLVNCVVENCVLTSNKGYGILIFSMLSQKAEPISITVRNCLIKSGEYGIAIMKDPKQIPVNGFMKFVNCRVMDSTDAGIFAKCFYSNGWNVVFEDCELKNTASDKPGNSPVVIELPPNAKFDTGNIEFKNCIVSDKLKRPLMKLNNLAYKAVVEKITGLIIYNGIKNNMPEYIKKNKMDVSASLAIAPIDLSKLFPYGGYKLKGRSEAASQLIFRRKVRFLVAANKGESVDFELKYKKLGHRVRPTKMKVQLLSPSGKNIKLKDAVLNQKNIYTFVASEKGVYQISCNPRGQILHFINCNFPYSIATPDDGALALYMVKGRIYFGIPAGISEFPVEISGQNTETISASIYIGNKLVASANKISKPKIFSIKCKANKELQIGSIVLSKAVEDSSIKLPAPLLPIFSTEKAELMIVSQRVAP